MAEGAPKAHGQKNPDRGYPLPGEPCRQCAGNNIFDALIGMPGTYIAYDMFGNMGFGFDVDLFYKTVNAIDSFRAGTSFLSQKSGKYPARGSLLLTGFVEVRRRFGPTFGDFFEKSSGVIYDFFKLQDEYKGKPIDVVPMDKVLELVRQLESLSGDWILIPQ